MFLSTGARLGPYEILSNLGVGGMGEVYRAKDTRLGREVAIKILPEAFARDSDRRARFETEARAASALHHPGIVTLFDIGSENDTVYLVSELVDGTTLRESRPESLRRQLDIAVQVAEALAAAHAAGITHRDLKPDNIMVTREGRAKILDFGLARRASTRGSETLETMTGLVTSPGTVLGTVGYMAPEQARGQETDGRSDIFSLGAVLYELFSGRRAFNGPSPADSLSAILNGDPDELPATVPNGARQIVEHCLEKDPERRFQSASNLAFALRTVGGSSTSIAHASLASPAAPRSAKTRISNAATAGWAVAILLAISTIGLSLRSFRAAPAEAPPIEAAILPPEGSAYQRWSASGLTRRPLDRLQRARSRRHDSALVAFARFCRGKAARHDRRHGRLSLSVLVAGRQEHRFCQWRQVVAYRGCRRTGDSAGERHHDARGDLEQRRCDCVWREGLAAVEGLCIGRGGEHGQHVDRRRELACDALVPPRRQALPICGANLQNGNRAAIRVGSLDSSDSMPLLVAESNAIYASGHLLFVRGGTLLAQSFDAARLALSGEAVPLAQNVQESGGGGNPVGSFSAAGAGTLIYATATDTGTELTWLDRSGKPVGTIGDLAAFAPPLVFLSPDGTSLTASIVDPTSHNSDIWRYDVARGLRSRLTFNFPSAGDPIWSPDGKTMVFDSTRTGRREIYRKAVDGSGPEEMLSTADGYGKFPNSWSPDGKFVLYGAVGQKTGSDSANNTDIWVLPDPLGPAGASKAYPFLNTAANEFKGRFSPDGRWVAYQSNESGRPEIYVVPFPGPGGKHQISVKGGTEPRWRRDGRELFYLEATRLMAVDIELGNGTLEAGASRPLFAPVSAMYDVSADGQRFIAPVAPERGGPPPLTLMLNWTNRAK